MTLLVARRALVDYVRRPFNVVLLVAVPIVIVVALAGDLANLSRLASPTAKPLHLDVATAGWAAALVAGLAGFFQVVGAKEADRRLASTSRRGAVPVVAGRLLASVGVALAATTAALVALALHGGIGDPGRAVPAVALVAVMYIAIGILVGTLVHSEMNGAVIVSAIWMLDVFVGSGLGGGSAVYIRAFPLHFPTMVLTSQAANHGGPVGDVGWSLIWTAVLGALAIARLSSAIRPTGRSHRHPRGDATIVTLPHAQASVGSVPADSPPSDATSSTAPHPALVRVPRAPVAAALCAAARDYGRNRVLWVLMAVVPAFFVAMAAAQTPTTLMPVDLIDSARHVTEMITLRHIHAAEMASVATGLLAGVTGLFVVTGSVGGDRRLVLAGVRPRQVLAGHLGVIAGAATLITAISLAVSAAFFSPQLWAEYFGADLLLALTYAMIGVLLGPLVGRLGGLYLILLLSIVDVGYGQSVMFHPLPPAWGAFLPSRGADRLLLDGAFTSQFEQYRSLILALAWLGALSLGAAMTFRHRIGVRPIAHLDARLATGQVESRILPRGAVVPSKVRWPS
jgi:hypothetical protein